MFDGAPAETRSQLSRAERTAIDEYLARGGKVTICPPRTFTDPDLVESKMQAGRPVSKATQERRDKVLALLKDGVTVEEIGRRLKVDQGRLDSDLQFLRREDKLHGIEIRREPKVSRKAVAASERRDRVVTAVQIGETAKKIAAREGVSVRLIKQDICDLRASGRLPKSTTRTEKLAEIKARRQKVLELITAGLTDAEIHQATGASMKTISNDVQALKRDGVNVPGRVAGWAGWRGRKA